MQKSKKWSSRDYAYGQSVKNILLDLSCGCYRLVGSKIIAIRTPVFDKERISTASCELGLNDDVSSDLVFNFTYYV